jgi:hypothetical protein
MTLVLKVFCLYQHFFLSLSLSVFKHDAKQSGKRWLAALRKKERESEKKEKKSSESQ